VVLIGRYILCEDSGGGFEFWKRVNVLLLDNYFDFVYSSEGWGSLPTKFEDIVRDHQCDLVMIAVDNVPKAVSSIRSVNSLSVKYGTAVLFTDYWCVEEVFVSFVYLSEWTKAKGSIVEIGDTVCEAILSGGMDRITEELVQSKLAELTGGKRKKTTREKFYKRLFGMLVGSGSGQFSLTKHSQDDSSVNTSCWFNDCITDKMNSRCQNFCGVPHDILTARGKLRCLFENSLLLNRDYGSKLVISSAPGFGHICERGRLRTTSKKH